MGRPVAKIQPLYPILPAKSKKPILVPAKKSSLSKASCPKEKMEDEISRLNNLAKQPPFCFIHKSNHTTLL
jgi:hypothetical protein